LLNYPFPVFSPDPNIPRSPIFGYVLRDLHPVPTSLYRQKYFGDGGGGGWRACSPTTKHSLDTGRPTLSRSVITGAQ